MQKDFIFLADLMTSSPTAGFIYVFSNSAYPGCIKIGKTTRLPGNRAMELSTSTAALAQFVIEHSWFVKKDLSDIEKTIHDQLIEFRVNTHREFFRLPVSDAIEKIGNIIADIDSIKWAGIKYRKRLDAKWGYFFQKIGVPFTYITKPIKVIGLSGGFFPDFFLPDQDCYLIIDPNFLLTNAGRLMAYCFAQSTGKVIFQFWDCQPGLEYDANGDLILHAGLYVTPEGEIDGMCEWGVCKKCGSRHIGHLGFPELCDRANRNTSKKNCQCHTDEKRQKLEEVYERVNSLIGTDY